jgi:hypothetical protein
MALEVFPGAVVLACPACGNRSWRPAGPDGERCIECNAWSPISIGVEDIECNMTGTRPAHPGKRLRMPEARSTAAGGAPEGPGTRNWVR